MNQLNQNRKYDFIVVGSGAGGSTVAMELAKKGKSVLVVERGVRIPKQNIDSVWDAPRYIEGSKITLTPRKSKEGTSIWRALVSGGSTMLSSGNGGRCLEKELSELSVNLDTEFAEMEEEMGIAPYDIRRLSHGAKALLEASKELGYKMEPMPKFIDPTKCRRCDGNCATGCKHSAKWNALRFLDKAEENGAEIMCKALTEKVLIENGKAKGVSIKGPGGRAEIMADAVILAAGGIGTPIILQNSGIKEAGSNFFVDLLVNTFGVAKGLSQVNDPDNPLVCHDFLESKGFIISPVTMSSRLGRFASIGIKGVFMPKHGTIGLMTKIKDETSGRIYPDGTISKPITARDRERLDEASSYAKEILIKAGASTKSTTVSKIWGGHPGGTAAIGTVVDKDLQTKVDNLFVSDASVLPTSPGLPPILTIAALAKRLSKALAP